MTSEDAYNYMVDGYSVSHERFGKNEFLYMDEQHIIRNETGIEFENNWTDQFSDWQTGWFIYKGKNAKHIDRSKNAEAKIMKNDRLIEGPSNMTSDVGFLDDSDIEDFDKDLYHSDMEYDKYLEDTHQKTYRNDIHKSKISKWLWFFCISGITVSVIIAVVITLVINIIVGDIAGRVIGPVLYILNGIIISKIINKTKEIDENEKG